jgi:hypothetical protein
MVSKKTVRDSREERLLEALRSNPGMFERIEAILALAREDDNGRIRSADEVEALLIEQIRRLGNETLRSWATTTERKVADKLKAKSPGVHQREKKTSNGGPPTGRSK